MGNHDIGRAFDMAFEVLGDDLIALLTKEQLLAKLDLVGNQFRGGDAAFGECLCPSDGRPISKVLLKVFGDELMDFRSDFTTEEWEKYEEEWWDKVRIPFEKRYDFW